MISLGLFVRLEAKPGKEKEVAAFLKQGIQMANQEATTELWFTLRLSDLDSDLPFTLPRAGRS